MTSHGEGAVGAVGAVDEAVRAAARRHERLVLAISGGRDSMVMLDAFARVAPGVVAAVATFDHATGEAAARAAALVSDQCARHRLTLRSGRGAPGMQSEAEWRAVRWSFLRKISREFGCRVATAHTRDDQVETVLMRTMRGAGARGLAGLAATGPVVRPLLDVPRAAVAAYAGVRDVAWIEDPSNRSRRFLRNRVRHDLLPALLAVRPALAEDLLAIGARAARLRDEVDDIAGALVEWDEDGALCVATTALAGYDPEALRLLWPALAARASVTLDRRGTERLARFTMEAAIGDRMQLSGPVHVVRRRGAIAVGVPQRAQPDPMPLRPGLRWGVFRFEVVARGADGERSGNTCWSARLPDEGEYIVRAWVPGDRMLAAGESVPRRVKRFLRDAGLAGPDRAGWPVVLRGDEIVWIPGVRRSDAATVRPGRPGTVYACERIEQRDRHDEG